MEGEVGNSKLKKERIIKSIKKGTILFINHKTSSIKIKNHIKQQMVTRIGY